MKNIPLFDIKSKAEQFTYVSTGVSPDSFDAMITPNQFVGGYIIQEVTVKDRNEELLLKLYHSSDEYVCNYPNISFAYALTNMARFEDGEAIIATSPKYAYRYAMEVLHAPFPLGEQAIYQLPDDSVQHYRVMVTKYHIRKFLINIRKRLQL